MHPQHTHTHTHNTHVLYLTCQCKLLNTFQHSTVNHLPNCESTTGIRNQLEMCIEQNIIPQVNVCSFTISRTKELNKNDHQSHSLLSQLHDVYHHYWHIPNISPLVTTRVRILSTSNLIRYPTTWVDSNIVHHVIRKVEVT